MSTRDLIDAIESGNSSAIQQHFQDAIMSRVAERLDTMRIETAKSMFKSSVNEAVINTSDYHATSEKSQFGGFRPLVKHKDTGDTMYLSAHSYKAPDDAKDHADEYLKAYANLGPIHADRAANSFVNANKHKLFTAVNESADFIHQVLADNDINSKVMGNTVHVDHDDVEKAQELVKYHGYDHKVIGGLNEAKKLIGTYDNGDHTAKVYHLSGEHDEGDPYHVKLFKDGKHHEPADYFTNDKDDAHSTAKDMVKRGTQRNESAELDETSCGTKKKWGAIKNSMGGSTKK